MDAGSPLVRAAARLTGRVVKLARAVNAWGWEGYRSAGGSGFVLNLGVLIIAVSSAAFVWLAVFQPVVPLRSDEVVLISPSDRIIDRDQSDDLMITRRMCMARGAQATVVREFVDGVVYTAAPSPPIQLHEGCNERGRSQDVPSTLPPGRYLYRVKLTFCNRLRCESVVLQDVPIVIRGRFPVDPTGPAGPMREPL